MEKHHTRNLKYTQTFSLNDLASSSTGRNDKKIENSLNLFLKKIENWLFIWILDMNAKKCHYMLFGRKTQLNQKQLNLKLFNDCIPKSKSNSIKFKE